MMNICQITRCGMHWFPW